MATIYIKNIALFLHHGDPVHAVPNDERICRG
jgi:hypothetical protein